MEHNVSDLMEFFEGQIEYYRKNFEVDGDDQEAKSFVQAFLIEMKKREKNGDDMEEFTHIQLKSMIFDLWAAGQETTTNTLNFGLLYLTTHPSVQSKMQLEIDQIVGRERRVCLSDRPKLHYTNAVINEVQRLCNLLPMNLFHRTTKDVVIDGHNVAKGTVILPQISVVMYNEKIFPDHESFLPERFLDENGQFKKIEDVVPFSIGKRQCPGESLSRDELFLFISNLYQTFKITPTDPKKLPSLEKDPGFTMKPKPYKVNLRRRTLED